MNVRRSMASSAVPLLALSTGVFACADAEKRADPTSEVRPTASLPTLPSHAPPPLVLSARVDLPAGRYDRPTIRCSADGNATSKALWQEEGATLYVTATSGATVTFLDQSVTIPTARGDRGSAKLFITREGLLANLSIDPKEGFVARMPLVASLGGEVRREVECRGLEKDIFGMTAKKFPGQGFVFPNEDMARSSFSAILVIRDQSERSAYESEASLVGSALAPTDIGRVAIVIWNVRTKKTCGPYTGGSMSEYQYFNELDDEVAVYERRTGKLVAKKLFSAPPVKVIAECATYVTGPLKSVHTQADRAPEEAWLATLLDAPRASAP